MSTKSKKSVLKPWQSLAVGIILAVGFLAALAPSPHVYAGGAVGSGGSGAGGGGGHQSSYGWGWAIYDVSDPGPADNMRDGSTWASARNTCIADSASKIYAFTIYNSAQKGMVYDYHTVYDSPSTYSAHFANGQSVQGGGVAIPSSSASTAFNSLNPADRVGFTFGTNVAWFCYDYQDWTLTPSISANDPTPAPGQVETWTFSVKNQGPSAATFKWTLQHKNPGGAYGAVSGQTGNITNLAAGSSNPSLKKWSLTIPGTAKSGDVYCAQIVASNGSGPSTGNVTAAKCVTVAASSKPKGDINIVCSPDGTSASATGTFSDSDGSASYPLKATLSSGALSASKTVPASSGSVPLNNAPVPMSGTVSFTLSVPDVGPAASAANNFSITKTKPCGGPPGAPCPATGDDTKPAENVPDAPAPVPSGIPSGSTAPAYTPSGGGQQYYKEVPGQITINSITDQWGNSADWTPKGYSSNPFTFDFTNYLNSYPYDRHDNSVQYTQKYTETIYTSQPDTSCSSGGTWNGSACEKSPNAYTSSFNCNSGDHNGGPGPNIIYCYHNSDNSYAGYLSYDIITYGCPGGTTASSSPVTSSTKCTYVTYYWQAAASSSTVYGSGNWTTAWTPSSTATGAPKYGECYYRGVSIQPAPDTQVNNINVPDVEDPTSVTYSGTGAVVFSANPAAPASASSTPHNPNYATLSYTIHPYYSSDPSATDGSSIPGCSDSGGSMVVGPAASFGQIVSKMTDGSQGTNPQYTCSGNFAPPMNVGDYFCATYTFMLAGDQVNQAGGFTNGNSSDYSVSQCQSPVTNEPYAQAFGADVSAGGKFSTPAGDCTGAVTNGGILGFIKASPSSPARGTSSQFAALALGGVSGFASASLRSSAPQAPLGLTFANTPIGTAGTFGNAPCIHNYYANLPAAPEAGPVATTGTHRYSLSGGTTLPGLHLGADANLAIYVSGNLNITGDITFDTSWGDTTAVSTLYIIASGNITIDPSVRQLDGVYISSGTIDTCSIPGGSDRYSVCNSQLTINGAFIAQKVQLNRTFASLRNSVAGELSDPEAGCDDNGAGQPARNYTCAGEIFKFSPEVFLGRPAISSRSGPLTGKFDFITSLSPVL